MQEEIIQYARLGLVHHMLYPRCMEDPDDHVRTLSEFARREDIETFDCCLPYGRERRERLIPLIRDCGKEHITYATHLFPLGKIGLSSPAPHEQAQIRMIIGDMVEVADAIGATGFIFASGQPSPSEATERHYEVFADFVLWLCGRLSERDMVAMLEPFDTDVDKRFLYGPTERCVELIESLRPDVDNLQIELDVAHLPLMGEGFEEAIRTVAPHLGRVHLGNCVLADPDHPRYGDTHPPIGYPPGEIGVPQTRTILQTLLDVGFLDREDRGDLVVEMTPWPGWSVEETVPDSFRRVEEAWSSL